MGAGAYVDENEGLEGRSERLSWMAVMDGEFKERERRDLSRTEES